MLDRGPVPQHHRLAGMPPHIRMGLHPQATVTILIYEDYNFSSNKETVLHV